MDTVSSQPVESIEVDQVVKDEDAGEDAANTNEDRGVSETAPTDTKVTSDQYKALKVVAEILYNHKVKIRGDEDYYPSTLFRRIPNKRNLPDYHEIIKEPTAISTLKQKIQLKKLKSVAEYVRDFALIVHNAQVYNRPNSSPVRDVFTLKAIFEEEMKKLVDQGIIAQEDTVFPDLGEIPYATPEPDPVSEDEEEVEDEGEEDDEDDDIDDSDDEKPRGRRRKGRVSTTGRKATKDDDEEGAKANDTDQRKRRGRPPKVDTPMEARIKAILKGIRKPKSDDNQIKIRHFERLPDKQAFPHYFQEIKEPIALDMIRKRSKRKKYSTLEQFMKDLNLMFNNAMEYNEDDSDLYKDAADLKAEAQSLLDIEKAKPDDEYLMEDGRLPLPNGIFYKNEQWKIGDWVHIQNPNDVTKPIVAQIYRTWQDPEGQKWVNACWYYRPEQTVHQYEKHFYPNEVVKTGQYRDHQIEEVIDKCFVMFFTRYSRGRPRSLKAETEVYVCEARYNEEKHKLNKIKTWASCLPDEVRDRDYEMDLFDAPRKIKKIPSPLLHLLKDDAKETDEATQPEWGHANAPPRVGAIHRQPRDENQSPPPEPTPPPPPTPPPQPVRAPSQTMQNRPGQDIRPISIMGVPQQPPRISPSMTPGMSTAYQGANASTAPSFNRQPSYQTPGATHPYAGGMPATPTQGQPLPYVPHAQLHPTPSLNAAHPTNYAGATPSQSYGRPQLAPTQGSQYGAYAAAGAQTSRPTDVFVLPDGAHSALPKSIRDQFPQDDQGRVLFFTTPPVDTRQIIESGADGEKGKPLAHSEAYFVAKKEREKKIAERKRAIEESESHPSKKLKQGSFEREILDSMSRVTVDENRIPVQKVEQENDRKKSLIAALDYITPINKDPWTGIYLDDQDPRYGF